MSNIATTNSQVSSTLSISCRVRGACNILCIVFSVFCGNYSVES